MSKLKTYRVTFAQTIFSSIEVKAADEAAAEDKAADRYETDTELLALHPVEGWEHEFGDYEISETEIVPDKKRGAG